jgi:hypothetical protein
MKTNFISNFKRYAFLALAVLGAFVGYSQSTQNPSIGGSKTPSTDPFGDFLLNIGGSQGTPRDTSGGMIVLSLDAKTQCIFAYPNDIGGGGKGTSAGGDTGQFGDDDIDPYDIGGGKSSDGGLRGLYGFNEIGGNGSTGGGKGTSSDTGQVNDDFDPYDIGGRGTNTGTGTGEFLSYEIGGKNAPGNLGPGSLGTNPFDDSDDDTGGRGADIRTGDFAMNSLEYIPGRGCDIETGGRDSGGGLLTNHTSDIGGKSSDTGLGLIVLADTGGRNGGVGTSTSGDYDDDDDDTGGRNSTGTTGESYELFSWDSLPN